MREVIKVFTPIKRVPIMIGKAQNGQKLPFGPYTLPQVGCGTILLLITAVCAMTLPLNPAVTFLIGCVASVIAVFAIGLVPYTGVRLGSRAIWLGRLLIRSKPTSASAVPITADSNRSMVTIEETIVLLLPNSTPVDRETTTGPALLESTVLAAITHRVSETARSAAPMPALGRD